MGGKESDINCETAASTARTTHTTPAEEFELAQVEAEEFKRPGCFEFFAKWKLCAGAQHQFHNYYVYGEFRPCIDEWREFSSCLSLKLETREDAKRIWSQREQKIEAEKTSVLGTIWEPRSEPPEHWYGPRPAQVYYAQQRLLQEKDEQEKDQ